MTKTLYNYTYSNPSGYSYSGQVVADTDVPAYNYVSGQTYNSPKGGTYTISGAGTPTSAPSGAVYQTTYTASNGTTYDSYHYDPASATYYDVNSGYNTTTGMTNGSSPVPAWSGIGLGNEYSYVNVGTMTAPSYQTYGGGGSASVNMSPGTKTAYDYKFLYPDGSYYLGKVVDDGTYGYSPGKTYTMGEGTYTIYATDPTPPASTALAGYNYVELYYDYSTGQNYPPSDIVPNSPYYQKPVGYGGLGTEKDYIQLSSGYHQFSDSSTADATSPVTAIPLPT
jgi:hypothetical protein